MENILDRWTIIYNNIMDWYTNLWHNTFGDEGMAIIGGITGLAGVALIVILGVQVFKKVTG